MSQENVEIVRQVYAAAAQHDTAHVLDFYDPEIKWDISHAPARGLMGEPHVFNGHEGLRTFFRHWYEAWKHVEPDLEALIDGGEQIISIETTRGRGRTSGAVVELPHAAVWTFREGKIVKVVWFGSRAEALEAAGLRSRALNARPSLRPRRALGASRFSARWSGGGGIRTPGPADRSTAFKAAAFVHSATPPVWMPQPSRSVLRD